MQDDDFMFTYGLYGESAQKAFLTSIDASEFCHIVLSSHGADLYVFCAQRELYKVAFGMELVPVYVKFELARKAEGMAIVISLHQIERPIYLPFYE